MRDSRGVLSQHIPQWFECIIESMKGFGIGLLVGVLLVLLVPLYDMAEGWWKWR